MLPNFTVVICGAVLTVLMLAVAGSGLIDPQIRTRIGAMPEIGRPMMQGMITEPAARGQLAALETSRRTEELMRLRDLAPAVAEPAPGAQHDDPDHATVESAAPAPQPPSDTSAAPAASAEAEPPAVVEAPAAVVEAEPAAAVEAAPATVAPAVPGTDATPLAVAIAEPAPPTAADAAPAPNLAAPTLEATTLAAEPAVDPPPATPESVVATTALPEAPPAADHSEPPAEPPASALQQLALAEPDAVPAPEAPAKLAARTGEPEEAAPVRRWVPRFVPRLPRIVPALSRLSPARLAHAPPRVTPTLVRHMRAKAKAEAAKQDIAKAAAAPRKPVRHWVRQVPHRAQRASVAPSTAVSPYPAYSVTSGVLYR
jgi:hypothetical protein